MSTLASLVVKLSADSAEFQNDLAKAAKAANNFEGKAVEALKAVGVAAAASAAAVSAATLIIVKQNLATIDALAKASDKLGITTEALTGLRHAANLSGVAGDQFDKSLEKMNKSLGEAARGTGEARKTLQDLGIPVNELIHAAPDQAFARISDEINKLGTQSEKAAAATKIFGDEGQSLLNVMVLGSEGFRAAADEAAALGITISRIDAAKVEAAGDAIARVQSAIGGVGQTLTVQLAPYIEVAAAGLVNLAKESGGFKEEIASAVEIAVDGAALMVRAYSGTNVVFQSLRLQAIDFQESLWGVLRAARATNLAVREGLEKVGLGSQEGTEESRRILAEQDEVLRQIALSRQAALAAGSASITLYEGLEQKVLDYKKAVQAAAQASAESVANAAAARIGSGGAIPAVVPGGNQDEEAKAKRDRYAADLAALEEYLGGEEIRIFNSSVRRAEMALALQGANIISETRASEMVLQLHEDHDTRLQELRNKDSIAKAEKLAADFATVEQYLLSDEERLVADYERRAAMVEEWAALDIEREAQKNSILEKLRADHLSKVQAMESRSLATLSSMKRSNFQDAVNLMQGFNDKSKGLAIAGLVLQKGLAMAETFIATQTAAAAALAPPPLGLGPVAGAGLAAAVQAQGAIRMGLIAATGLAQVASPSGGPTNSLPYSSGAANVAQDTDAFGQRKNDNQSTDYTFNLTVNGNIVDHDQFARETFAAFQRAANDGMRR